MLRNARQRALRLLSRLAGRIGAGSTEPCPKDVQIRLERSRFHLGRGRRARDRGAFRDGAREARQALAYNPGNPWAHALLGQCLRRLPRPDLQGARLAFERACALDPTNGYFVGLLVDVLAIQGDLARRRDVLAWAWWSGAPVERWLGAAGPVRRGPVDAAEGFAAPESPAHRTVHAGSVTPLGVPV